MNKRLSAQMAGAFIFGVAVVEFPKIQMAAACLFYAVICFLGNLKIKKGKRIWFFLFFFLAGYGRYSLKQEAYATYAHLLEDGMEVSVQGEIYQKELKKEQMVLSIKNSLVQIHKKNYSCNQIIIYLDADSYSIGQTICVKGKIKLFQQARNQGNFDAVSYYKSLGTDFSLYGEKVLSVHGKRDDFKEGLGNIKKQLISTYQKCMNEEDAGVCSAMVLGDKTVLSDEVKDLYQKAGISHILAISGLHISIIGMACYLFLKKIGMSFLTAFILAGGGIMCYGQLCGFGISARRAIFMFILVLFARLRGRAYDLATGLSLTGAAMLFLNPFLLKNAGFLLSFSAVAAIAMFQEKTVSITEPEAKGERRGEPKWKETLGMSLFIQLLTIPLLASFFFQIPLYGIVINLFVLPFAGGLLGFSIAGGVLGSLNTGLGKLVLFPAHVILWLYEKLCVFFAGLPGAQMIVGKLSENQLLLWYILIAIIVLLRTGAWKRGQIRTGVTGAMFSLFCILAYQGPSGFEMSVLDVGQGDGIYMRTGGGSHMFIDGGSTSVAKVGTYRILPFLKSKGVRKIDYWFVSHVDEDHVNGLEEILKSGYPIEHLVVSKYIVLDEAYGELYKMAKEQGVKVLKMNQGESLWGGNKKTGGFRVQSLYPGKNDSGTDRNANSLVLLYEEGGFSALLTGDISTEEEKRLLSYGKLPAVTVYKAAHHGSKASNSEAFLEALAPKVSVVSCGENNRYGHPGEEAISNMEKAGSRIYDTRYCGEISIKNDGSVSGFLEEGESKW